MNNYILNSGYFTYDSKTYNYVETNNQYAFPYVFKTDLLSDSPIYVKRMSPYGSVADVSGSFSPDGTNLFGSLRVFYEIKARGVATIKEAAEIGETTSDSNLLIIKNSLGNYNCLLKDTTTIEYDSDNLCINYDDIKKREITSAYFNILLSAGGSSFTPPYYIDTAGSNVCQTFTNYNADTNRYRIKIKLQKNQIAQYQMFKPINFKHSGSTINKLKIIGFFYNSLGHLDFNNLYQYTYTGDGNFTEYDEYGLQTSTEVHDAPYYAPSNLQIYADDVNLIFDKVNAGYFDNTGSGTENDPYDLCLIIN